MGFRGLGHLPFESVWRTFVRLGRIMINHNPSNGRFRKLTKRPLTFFL
jgi:hypothetical protein